MARLFIVLIFFLVPLSAHAESAEEMVSSCKAILDAPVRENRVYFDENMDAGKCWGAFGVIQQIGRLRDNKTGLPHVPMGCVPATSTRSQAIAIFIEFARQNPQKLHEEFTFVAMEALQKSFPCAGQKVNASPN